MKVVVYILLSASMMDITFDKSVMTSLACLYCFFAAVSMMQNCYDLFFTLEGGLGKCQH